MRNIVLLQELRRQLGQQLLESGDELDRVAADPYLSTLFILSKRKKIFSFEPSTNEVRIKIVGKTTVLSQELMSIPSLFPF